MRAQRQRSSRPPTRSFGARRGPVAQCAVARRGRAIARRAVRAPADRHAINALGATPAARLRDNGLRRSRHAPNAHRCRDGRRARRFVRLRRPRQRKSQGEGQIQGQGPGGRRLHRPRPSGRTGRIGSTRTAAENVPPGWPRSTTDACLPGQAKRRYIVGQRLPATVVVERLPPVLVTRLGPAPTGYEYGIVDGDVLRLALGTQAGRRRDPSHHRLRPPGRGRGSLAACASPPGTSTR